MLRVVKVAEKDVYVLNEENQIMKLNKEKFDWDVKVEEKIELYEASDGEIIVTKVLSNNSEAPNIKQNTEPKKEKVAPLTKIEDTTSKTWLGIFCGIMIGWLGFVVAFAFPQHSKERESFLLSWVITSAITTFLGLIIFLVAILPELVVLLQYPY